MRQFKGTLNSISYTVARDKREISININPFTGKIRWRRGISRVIENAKEYKYIKPVSSIVRLDSILTQT